MLAAHEAAVAVEWSPLSLWESVVQHLVPTVCSQQDVIVGEGAEDALTSPTLTKIVPCTCEAILVRGDIRLRSHEKSGTGLNAPCVK